MPKEKYSLDEILERTRQSGPRVVEKLGIRLTAEDAELIALCLQDEGFDVDSYDFPNTFKVWQDAAKSRKATKTLISLVGKEINCDPRTFEGFKRTLPHLTAKNFAHKPINSFGTKLSAMLRQTYGGSNISAILDLINKDDEFAGVRDLKPYDFPHAAQGTWKDRANAREVTKALIYRIATEIGVDPTTFEGFKQALPLLSQDAFNHKEINRWGTKLAGMLVYSYNSSNVAAVLDLINNHDEFTGIRDIRPYDFPHAAQGTWKDRANAREATKVLVYKIATEIGVDPTTFEGFKQVLPLLSQDAFNHKEINRWGTTLSGMISEAYAGSNTNAVLDLLNNNDEFAGIRDIKPYDFPRAPMGSWKDKINAREATKTLIYKIASKINVNPTTPNGFKQILPLLVSTRFHYMQINRWGTQLNGMLNSSYGGNRIRAILDLLENDPQFNRVRRCIRPRALIGSISSNIKRRVEGRYHHNELIKHLSESGLNLSDYGFYSFSKGEKSTVRDLIAECALNNFGDRPISYFGLEGPTFGSYFALARRVRIDPKKSLIPERDERAYHVMEQIKRMKSVNKLLNGSHLSAIELVPNNAESSLRNTQKKFDLIFLDWLGHIAPSGQRELELAYSHLNETGMIAVTVNTKGISEARFRQMTKEATTQDGYMKRWAGEKGLAIQDIDYVGGDKIRTPMKLYIMKRR